MSRPLSPKIPREAFAAAAQYLQSLPQASMALRHHFATGVYCRELAIPANTILIGKIHKHETLNVLLQGRIEIAMECGGISVMEAPLIFVSPAGTQKVGRTLTDTIWLNFHATPETDLSIIEKEFTTDSFGEYDRFRLEQSNAQLEREIKCHGG